MSFKISMPRCCEFAKSQFHWKAILVLFLTVPVFSSEPPKTLPAFALPDLEGKQHMSASWKGSVVVLDFWATWCVACREAFPVLSQLQSQYGSKLAVVGISTDKGEATKLKKFGKKQKLEYLVLHDPDERVGGLFGFQALPALYVYDRAGNLLAYFQGLEKESREKLEKLLAAQFQAN